MHVYTSKKTVRTGKWSMNACHGTAKSNETRYRDVYMYCDNPAVLHMLNGFSIPYDTVSKGV